MVGWGKDKNEPQAMGEPLESFRYQANSLYSPGIKIVDASVFFSITRS